MKHHKRDAMRRYARRGAARAVLENAHNAQYMSSHPIALDMARTYKASTIERLATERNPVASTGGSLFCMGGGTALWP